VTFPIARFARWAGAVTALAVLAAPLAAQRWESKYLYDKDKSGLVFMDIAFPSPQRGVAVGYETDGKHEEPVSLITTDAGEHWQRLPLKAMPHSLFFLNEKLGWLVTDGPLYRTTDQGRHWAPMPRPEPDMGLLGPGMVMPEAVRVLFVDEKHGWAIGSQKLILETHDGGSHWKPVKATPAQPGSAYYSAYTWIAVADPNTAMITGWNIPPRRWGNEKPDWVDPQSVLMRPDVPHLNYTVTTHDGGKTWSTRAASVFGEVERFRFLPDGRALGLTVYSQSFHYPSEVFRFDWHTGKSARVYRDQNFAVSDIWLSPSGTAYLAGTSAQGKLRDVVPGKVRVLASKDYVNWKEIDVDYRAEAHRVIITAADEDNLWIATDMGMILKLAPAQ